ncbi:MAG TPA: DUF2232 domain-containing protein [Longimicrobiales bacterium]|nr:DUF2232 domain-containing protein [Longimicrobiales bacterium]
MTGRGPGWPTVLVLALAVVAFSAFHPLQLMALPMAVMLVALPPRSPRTLVMAGVLLVLTFTGARGALWSVERGWSLLVGGWFILAVLAWPGASFVARATAAVAGATASAAALIVATGGWEALDWTITMRYREVAEAMAAVWPSGVADATIVERAAELPAMLFPALLAIGTLAALAVGWWGYGRLARRGPLLGTLPQFRFPDPLVWVLIAGLVLVLLPLTGWASRLGGNLILFMGALYALRGLAVVVALVGPHVPALIILGVVGLLLYPIVVAGTLVVGVTDTWVDLRAARRAARDEG